MADAPPPPLLPACAPDECDRADCTHPAPPVPSNPPAPRAPSRVSSMFEHPPLPSDLLSHPPLPSDLLPHPPLPSDLLPHPPLPSDLLPHPPLPSDLLSHPPHMPPSPMLPARCRSHNEIPPRPPPPTTALPPPPPGASPVLRSPSSSWSPSASPRLPAIPRHRPCPHRSSSIGNSNSNSCASRSPSLSPPPHATRLSNSSPPMRGSLQCTCPAPPASLGAFACPIGSHPERWRAPDYARFISLPASFPAATSPKTPRHRSPSTHTPVVQAVHEAGEEHDAFHLPMASIPLDAPLRARDPSPQPDPREEIPLGLAPARQVPPSSSIPSDAAEDPDAQSLLPLPPPPPPSSTAAKGPGATASGASSHSHSSSQTTLHAPPLAPPPPQGAAARAQLGPSAPAAANANAAAAAAAPAQAGPSASQAQSQAPASAPASASASAPATTPAGPSPRPSTSTATTAFFVSELNKHWRNRVGTEQPTPSSALASLFLDVELPSKPAPKETSTSCRGPSMDSTMRGQLTHHWRNRIGIETPALEAISSDRRSSASSSNKQQPTASERSPNKLRKSSGTFLRRKKGRASVPRLPVENKREENWANTLVRRLATPRRETSPASITTDNISSPIGPATSAASTGASDVEDGGREPTWPHPMASFTFPAPSLSPTRSRPASPAESGVLGPIEDSDHSLSPTTFQQPPPSTPGLPTTPEAPSLDHGVSLSIGPCNSPIHPSGVSTAATSSASSASLNLSPTSARGPSAAFLFDDRKKSIFRPRSRPAPVSPSVPSQGHEYGWVEELRDDSDRPTPRKGEDATAFLARVYVAVPRSEVLALLAREGDGVYAAALHREFGRLDWAGYPLDMALRALLMCYSLPRETQQIDRVLLGFAARYTACNPTITEEEAYVLAFSLLMLHTDHFNSNNRSRTMNRAGYVRNTRASCDLPEELLEYFYDNIVVCEFVHAGSAPRAKRKGLDPYPFIMEGNISSLHLPCDVGEVPYLPPPGDDQQIRQTFLSAPSCELASPGSVQPEIPNPGQVGVGGSAYYVDEGSVRMVQMGVLNRVEEKEKDKEKKLGPFYWGAVLSSSQILWFRDPEVPALLAHTLAVPDELTNLATTFAFLYPTDGPDLFTMQDGRRTMVLSTGVRDPDQERTFKWVRLINFAASYRWAGVRRVDEFLASQRDILHTISLADPPSSETYAQVNTYAADLVARTTLAHEAYSRARGTYRALVRKIDLLRPCAPLSRLTRERLGFTLLRLQDDVRAAHLAFLQAQDRLRTIQTDFTHAYQAGTWAWLTRFSSRAPPGLRPAPSPALTPFEALLAPSA